MIQRHKSNLVLHLEVPFAVAFVNGHVLITNGNTEEADFVQETITKSRTAPRTKPKEDAILTVM